MRAMTVVVARKRRVIAAGISNAVVNGVMPVIVVIGCDSIPAADNEASARCVSNADGYQRRRR